jgi:hypothetical protein
LGTNTANYGVLGVSGVRGVQGTRVDVATGLLLTAGVLGFAGTSGVHSFDDITIAVGGTKSFIAPHPNDPSKKINFVSLEGNEVGNYFRGRGRFQRGLATIEVPEAFRLVTEPEGLSIQVTPIGEMASVAVVSLNLDRIVVKASRNVEFFYTVNGVRKGHAEFSSIQKNDFFLPTSADDTMIEWDELTRSFLVSNGVLTPEGKVNLETARRLGWDREWERTRLRREAQQEADREADRLGLPEGTVPARYPD